MSKILLELYDNVVVTATIITQAEIDSTTTTPPYYTPIQDYAGKSFDQIVSATHIKGRYNHALRKRDRMKGRGVDMDVMIVDGNDPAEFWYKKYNKKKKTFDNIDGETEQERQERIKVKKSIYPLKQSDGKNVIGDEFGYMIPDQAEVDSILGAGTFGEFFKKRVERTALTPADLQKIESNLSKFSEATRVRVIFQIARHLYMEEHNHGKDWDLHKKWWTLLIGTELEARALTELASIHMQKQEYDEAADLYEHASKRPGVSTQDKAAILEKLDGCGRGVGLLKKAEMAMEKGDTETAKKFIDEFRSKATGIVKHLHEERAHNMKNICECREHRKRNDLKSVEKTAKKTREGIGKTKRHL